VISSTGYHVAKPVVEPMLLRLVAYGARRWSGGEPCSWLRFCINAINHVAQVFYVLDAETEKHVVVSTKEKIVGVENMKDNDEDVNQFEEMSLFSNQMNIKHIEKDFDK
jgi:hypothetical protein